jgi:nucleoside-diphosphate-sugar epimerase
MKHSSKIVVGMLRHLLEASEPSGVRTIVFPSLFAIYGNHGAEWVTEDVPIKPDSFSEQYREAEDLLLQSTEAGRSAGVVLRMGLVYASDAPHTRGLSYTKRQAPTAQRRMLTGRRFT